MVDSEWDDMNSKYPSKITENIYQGGYLCSENKEILQNLGITHILVASFGLRQHFPDNFKYLQINCHDNSEQDMSQFYDTVYEFIDGCISNEGKILIHCAAGISRSSTCTCVYLMKKNKWSYDTTLEFIQKRRKWAQPNMGFTNQLKKFEITVLSEKEIIKENKDKIEIPISIDLIENK